MKGRLFLACAAIILLIALLWLPRWENGSRQSRQPVAKEATPTTLLRDDAAITRRDGTGAIDRAARRDPLAALGQTGPDAIENEFVLRFPTPEELQEFLQQARERGADVLGRIDQLNAVRLRVRSREELRALLRDAPVPSELGYNYWARLPDPGTDPRLPEGVYAAFGNKALEWLGIEGGNQQWGKGVTVAVLDTGIESHPTLAGLNVTRLDLLGPEVSATGDRAGHGTAVASVLAGSSPDAPGIAPGADILSIRVAGGDGVGNGFTLAWAIVEAVERGVEVVSLSLGSRGDAFILQQAVNHALANGVAVVASTGNDSVQGVSYPGRYDGVIAVTAVDANGRHMYFANRGEEVDLAAPGFGVNAAWSEGQIVGFSGTSAAVPFVAGAVATLLYAEPRLTPTEAAGLLVTYANDAGMPGHDSEYGSGILSMDRVLNRDKRGIFDMAMAGIYFDSLTGSVIVSAQNRGTEKLFHIVLDVKIDAVAHSVPFFNVGVGQVVHQRFPVDMARLRAGAGVYVYSSVALRGIIDSKPGNNVRNVILHQRQ